jgi:hypothetical protein
MKLYCPLNYDFTIKNIEISNNNIKECNKILNKKYGRVFGSVLKKEDNYYLFLTLDQNSTFTNMNFNCKILTSKNGIEFKEEKEEIKLKAVGNNIAVSNVNNEIVIYGGRHCGKTTQSIHNKINCVCKNNNYHSRTKAPFPIAKGMFYNNGKGSLPFLNDNFYHPCHMNGIYFFNFDDLKEAKIKLNRPVISGLQEGMIDNVFGGNTFDSQNSILFCEKNKLYYFFCRLNGPIKGRRHIQYSSSKNLIDWKKEFSPIEIENWDMSKSNFYSPNFFKYPGSDFYIGILTDFSVSPMFTLLFSEDLKIWKNKGHILKFGRGSKLDPHFRKNICGNGLVVSPDNKEFYLYVYDTVYTFWYRYSIRKDGFKSLLSKKEKIGTIEFNEPLLVDKIVYLNYKTFEKGYIKIKFYLKDDLIFNKELTGDFVNKEIDIPKEYNNKEYKIKIELYMSEFFSITI